MANIKPTDDAIAIAAARLAQTLIELRKPALPFDDFAAHQQHVKECSDWAVDQLSQNRSA